MLKVVKHLKQREITITLAAVAVWLLLVAGLLTAFAQVDFKTESNILVKSRAGSAGQQKSDSKSGSPKDPDQVNGNSGSPTTQQMGVLGLSTQSVQVWSPQFMGFGTVGNQADYHPEKFSIFSIDYYNKYQSTVNSLHSQGVKTFVYFNGSFKNQQDLGPNGDGTGTYPESSYAHTASGQHITENDFPNNVLMNPRDATWQQSLIKKCQYRATQANFDGCFFDTIGTAPVTASYVSPGLPVDPNTGAEWTSQAYLAAMVAEMQLVKAGNPSRLIYGNGLGSGAKYYDSGTSALVNGLDGVLAEQFTKSTSTAPNDTEANWKKNVDMLADVNAKGKVILTTTKSWESPAASRSQKDIWHKFALSTFLLGSSARSYFSFTYDHTTTSPSTYQSWWDVDIGSPAETYSKTSGVYKRKYTKGLVVVNPSTTAVTYPLGGSYTSIGSAQPITSITLPARSGEVLSAVTSTAPPTNSSNGGGASSSTNANTPSTNAEKKPVSSKPTEDSSTQAHQDNQYVAEQSKSTSLLATKLFGGTITQKNAMTVAFVAPLILVGLCWALVMYLQRHRLRTVMGVLKAKAGRLSTMLPKPKSKSVSKLSQKKVKK